MAHKPYHDPREQSVAEPIATTPEEQSRRNAGIAVIGELVATYGTTRVLSWLYLEQADPQVAALVNAFGVDLIRKWVGYFGHQQPRLAPSPVFDRPADRCLADGAALINKICVQCGRDNS